MAKLQQKFLTAAAAAALLLGSTPVLAEEQAEMKDMSTRMCKELMILSGEDRVIALAFIQGYRLGKKNTTKYDPEALGQLSDKLMDYCLDNPKEKALAAFEKIAN